MSDFDWEDEDIEDKLDEINNRLEWGQQNAQGMMLSNAMNNMSAGMSVVAVLFGIFYLPYWIYKKIKERREDKIKSAESWRKWRTEEEKRKKIRADMLACSTEAAMRILEQIKKEDYKDDDPFWVPITQSTYQEMTTDQLKQAKKILEEVACKDLRGALRYILSLPEKDAKEELANLSTELAERVYKKATGKEEWDDLPKAVKDRINKRIREEEYDLRAEEEATGRNEDNSK